MELKQLSRIDLPMGVLDVAVTKDRANVYAATLDGLYRVVAENGAYERLGQHDSWVSGVALLEEDARLVTAGYDGRLQFRRVADPEPQRTVDAHGFWSWKLAAHGPQGLVASVSGQYLAGAEDYTPRPAEEPTVKVFDAVEGTELHAFEMLPSVQAVAFSPDGQHLAAANLMGDIKVWDLQQGQLRAEWRSDDFTSWGIIKSHCYIGGIHGLMFSADGSTLYAAGMGEMRDPMAGNGRQLWQQFAWREQPVAKVAETKRDQAGEGLMETLALHPSGEWFVMAGRLRGGDWNVGLFSTADGERIGQLNTGVRVTSAVFSHDGTQLLLAGMKGQPGPNAEGEWGNFGVIDRYALPSN